MHRYEQCYRSESGQRDAVLPVIFVTNFDRNFRTRISPIQSKSSHLEILGLEPLLDQKILLNISMITLAEAVILRLMKKLKNLLKDQEDHLHQKNIINNRNIILHQQKNRFMMQMMKVSWGPFIESFLLQSFSHLLRPVQNFQKFSRFTWCPQATYFEK